MTTNNKFAVEGVDFESVIDSEVCVNLSFSSRKFSFAKKCNVGIHEGVITAATPTKRAGGRTADEGEKNAAQTLLNGQKARRNAADMV